MLAQTILAFFYGASLASAGVLRRSPQLLQHDDVILYSKSGRVEIRKRAELDWLNNSQSRRPVHLSNDTTPLGVFTPPAASTPGDSSRLGKRDDTTIIMPNAPADFEGWDVPMSSVVKGGTIAVTAGYSIADALATSLSVAAGDVAEFLQATLQITYTKTWTSTYTTAYTFVVPADKYGAVVSNPNTHRESGTVFVGRIGSVGQLGTYQGDSYSSKSYESLSWVDGLIQLCTGDSYPLARCLGEGNL